MSRTDHPDLPEQLRALQRCLEWASECRCVWIDTSEGGVIRNAGELWCELRLRSVAPLGVDDRYNTDLGNVPAARQECIVGTRILGVQATFRSRRQDFDDPNVAWYAALRAQLRLQYSVARTGYLKDAKLALLKPGDVLNMPMVQTHDDRVEDYAVLELSLSALISETENPAAAGYWLEQIEATSMLRHSPTTALAPSLQLDDEVMP